MGEDALHPGGAARLGELARRVRLITDRGARTAGVGEHSEMVEAWTCGIVLFG